MTPMPLSTPQRLMRYALILFIVSTPAALFAYAGGWMSPSRLTPARFVDAFDAADGPHPGYRRNHAKGVCVSGEFVSNGRARAYSVAGVFDDGMRTPVSGRFAIPGPNPDAPDHGSPVRSLALRFDLPGGRQWRSAMNNSPVFPVATPRAFFERMAAYRPDPSTGRPVPARVAAFREAFPETERFVAWAGAETPSASWATETYRSLNAFYLVDAQERRWPVRWRMQSESPVRDEGPATDSRSLVRDLHDRLAAGPLRWRLIITLGEPGDPTDDATRAWPAGRREVDAGTLSLSALRPESDGACRDINFDPTVLPAGIELSDDPLLVARSAVYAESHRRRLAEGAGLPGFPSPTPHEAGRGMSR